MAILKCKMCGGTLDYDREQNLAICPYCGSKSTVFDQNRKLFEQYQNQYAALLNHPQQTVTEEGFWVETSREELLREDGNMIEINYFTKQPADMCTMYVAKQSVLYLFEEKHAHYAARYQEMIQKLVYPTPEMERHLSDYIPKMLTQCRLSDGRILLALRKKEGLYPLNLLGVLLDRHVAWIISRLENLCCLLDYNDIVLNGFAVQNLFVEPAAHQIYLYGGWWFAGVRGEESVGASQDVVSCLDAARKKMWNTQPKQKVRNHPITDLKSIRLTAAKLLGYPDMDALKEDTLLPKAFRKFLLETPKQNAREDFATWDKTLLAAYGERKFIPLPMTEEEIYSRHL
ncbi:MAG: hypothetical protein HFH82_15005 [Lachnospiraceae bacterium]|nr:hypothetical protein [Lachnospiraceae bacterium]